MRRPRAGGMQRPLLPAQRCARRHVYSEQRSLSVANPVAARAGQKTNTKIQDSTITFFHTPWCSKRRSEGSSGKRVGCCRSPGVRITFCRPRYRSSAAPSLDVSRLAVPHGAPSRLDPRVADPADDPEPAQPGKKPTPPAICMRIADAPSRSRRCRGSYPCRRRRRRGTRTRTSWR